MMYSCSIAANQLGRSRTFLAIVLALLSLQPVGAQTNFTFRVMAANLTSGTQQSYESPGLRIMEGMEADIVAIQEFNYLGDTPSDIRTLVDTAFGTNFAYYRESGYDIPNGIISRWPILLSGSWVDTDPGVNNRGFAWANIDLPGTNDLYVVSVHFKASSGGDNEARRAAQASEVKDLISSNFPPNAWVIVAGDFNLFSETEAATQTLETFLSDEPVPADGNGNPNTNAGRSERYDRVLPSFSLTNALTNVVFPSQSFANGLVFDSGVYSPLTDVPPVQSGDSDVTGMQHMAVVKDFYVSEGGTNPPPAAPEITDQPDSLGVIEGDNAPFAVTATGDAPLAYQWRFNNAPIPGATGTNYTRLNAQLADAGGYTVVVTNNSGSVTSAVAVLTVNQQGGGTGEMIAQWNFNSIPPDGSTETGTLVPHVGSGNASIVGGISQTFFSGSGSSDPAASDNSALGTQNYPSQDTGNKSAGVQFNVSTVGKENISVSWDVRASNTGSKYARLQYTTNGTTFVDFPSPVINLTSFGPQTNNLNTLAGVSDNPAFAFRIVAEFENTATGSGDAAYAGAGTTYGTAGTLRYDMMTVYGSTIIPPLPMPATLSDPMYMSGQFQFQLTGQAGAAYVVETSTNLIETNWIPVWTNVSPFLYLDTNTVSAPLRFYRAQSQP